MFYELEIIYLWMYGFCVSSLYHLQSAFFLFYCDLDIDEFFVFNNFDCFVAKLIKKSMNKFTQLYDDWYRWILQTLGYKISPQNKPLITMNGKVLLLEWWKFVQCCWVVGWQTNEKHHLLKLFNSIKICFTLSLIFIELSS